MSVQCYAQRLLNPFRGTLSVIKFRSAEAVTTDGQHWNIFVSNDELAKDLECSGTVLTSDIRYGSWSKAKGLKRGPIYPSDDFLRMEAMGDVVFEHLLELHDQLPFKLQDVYELWLLDEHAAPLALLDSAVCERDIDYDQAALWRIGNLCHDTFHSASLPPREGPSDTPDCTASHLMRYINQLAGNKPLANWFRRTADNSGISLNQELQNLPAILFPQYLIRTQGHPEPYQQLIDEFLTWQAPWLLLLDTLTDDQRQTLEYAARQHALLVEQHYRSYPKILNEDVINAARIEAKMRQTQPQRPKSDNTMSTFYLELHSPSPTE